MWNIHWKKEKFYNIDNYEEWNETKESKEVKEVAAEVEKKVEEAVDYAKLTVAELKSLCKEKGIEVLSTMKKNDLVEALKK